MTKDGPLVRGHKAPMPEASTGLSPHRGDKGGRCSCSPPPPPPRPPTSAPFHKDHRRELEALRAELDAERLRSQEARCRFALENRELREAAQRKRQLLADQLRSKWEQQRALELHQLKEAGLRERETEIRKLFRWKETELHQAQELLQRERNAAILQARDLQRKLAKELVGRCKGQGLSGDGCVKLQEVLGKLSWEVDSEQDARIRHLKAELELERSLFLKYILQRFEGEEPSQGFPQRSPFDHPKVAKSGPHSLSSLMAVCRGSKSHSLDGDLNQDQQVKQLKRKNAKLAGIAKRLEETAKRLQEASLKVAYPMQVLKEKLSEKSKQCENLEREMEEKQKRCDDLEAQLKEVLKENVRIKEENSHLHKKNELAEKIENENTEINMKVMQATDACNSAVELTKELENKAQNLQQIISNLKEIVERRQQLVCEHEQTLLVLPKKEEIQQTQQIQTKTKRENEETVEHLETQVKEVENQYHSETECFNLLSQGLGQLKEKKSGILELGSLHATYPSASIIYPPEWNEDICHSFHICGNGKNADKSPASIECTALLQKAKVLETHLSASESDSILNSSWSGPNPKKDTTDETQEPETDNIFINLELENPGLPKLCVFPARYSYNPFDGPNNTPETELSLTAGEYVYIFGKMDEDGFYEGELMDGRRGMILSTLVEEVSSNDLTCFLPLEASDISYHSYHEIRCPYQNASSEEGNDNPNEDVCVNLFSNEFGAKMWDDQTILPYPRNLTHIRQFAKSIIIDWAPPQVPDNRGEVHSYNISVNTDLCCNLKHSSQMKAMTENLDPKFHSYQISLQSVTNKGHSDKLQCTFFVGSTFHIAPTLFELRSVTATSAEISWLPRNSNYTHTMYINEKECDVTETGVYWYTFCNLKANSQYNIKVKTRAPFEELFPQGHLEQKSRVITFTTLLVGLPNPPLDVQAHPNSSAKFLIISWLPVTIDAAGSSNVDKVTDYTIYMNAWKITEVMSPVVGSVSLEASQLRMFHGPCKVFVKILSPYEESVDSVPALIPATLLNTSRSFLPIPVVCNQAPPSLKMSTFLWQTMHLCHLTPTFLSSTQIVMSPFTLLLTARSQTLPYLVWTFLRIRNHLQCWQFKM